MIKQLIHTISLILLTVCTFYGQSNPIGEYVSFPSPQAAQFNRFGGNVINYSTGTPMLTVPIYTAEEGDLMLPISIHYSYDGFKPANEPGWLV